MILRQRFRAKQKQWPTQPAADLAWKVPKMLCNSVETQWQPLRTLDKRSPGCGASRFARCRLKTLRWRRIGSSQGGFVLVPAADTPGSFRSEITAAASLINYSVTASFSITTFRCAVTSLCSFTGTVNSPSVFSGSCSWILRRSTLRPFLASASAISLEVTDPNS